MEHPTEFSAQAEAAAEPLASALVMLEPLVRWCISQGIGHGQLSRASKLVFFEQAQLEIEASGVRQTDSALSLHSGLHKGDVLAFKAAQQPSDGTTTDAASAALRQSVLDNSLRISPAQQVLAKWYALGLPEMLPFKATQDADNDSGAASDPSAITSFSQLVQSTDRTSSQGYSPRLMAQDMQRQGLVSHVGNQVHLLGFGGVSRAQMQERTEHFVSAARDFLMAGVSNLETPDAPPFLEQSFNGDGFSTQSVQELQTMARQWWSQTIQAIGPEALAMNQTDEPRGGAQRLRFGVYFYAEPGPPPPQKAVDT